MGLNMGLVLMNESPGFISKILKITLIFFKWTTVKDIILCMKTTITQLYSSLYKLNINKRFHESILECNTYSVLFRLNEIFFTKSKEQH